MTRDVVGEIEAMTETVMMERGVVIGTEAKIEMTEGVVGGIGAETNTNVLIVMMMKEEVEEGSIQRKKGGGEMTVMMEGERGGTEEGPVPIPIPATQIQNQDLPP